MSDQYIEKALLPRNDSVGLLPADSEGHARLVTAAEGHPVISRLYANWDERTSTLSGVLVRPGGYSGHLIITVPKPYCCALEEVATGVHRCPLTATSGRTPWSIRLKKTHK